jgi:hypothetical protein
MARLRCQLEQQENPRAHWCYAIEWLEIYIEQRPWDPGKRITIKFKKA